MSNGSCIWHCQLLCVWQVKALTTCLAFHQCIVEAASLCSSLVLYNCMGDRLLLSLCCYGQLFALSSMALLSTTPKNSRHPGRVLNAHTLNVLLSWVLSRRRPTRTRQTASLKVMRLTVYRLLLFLWLSIRFKVTVVVKTLQLGLSFQECNVLCDTTGI